MRRQWYTAFGIVVIVIFLILTMLHDMRWFFVFFTPVIFLWIYDLLQKKHTILRNFPVLGHILYILEFIRPEIQQYFITTDEDERPFNREIRSIIYQHAKMYAIRCRQLP